MEPLIYIHIPKNAGTSLHSIIENNYRASEVFTFHYPREKSYCLLDGMSQDKRDRLKVIKGHWQYGLHGKLNANARYITLLRDPVERLVSEYNYVMRNPKNSNHRKIVKEEIGIVEALERKYIRDNGQVRWLIDGGLGEERGIFRRDGLSAWENLENHRSLIGFVERFDESVLLFAKLLGWSRPWYVRRNVAPIGVGGKVSKELRDELEEFVEADRLLVEIAEKWFVNEIQKLSDKRPNLLQDFLMENERRVRKIKLVTLFRYCYSRSVWKINGTW